jgi:hypothetical protein
MSLPPSSTKLMQGHFPVELLCAIYHKVSRCRDRFTLARCSKELLFACWVQPRELKLNIIESTLDSATTGGPPPSTGMLMYLANHPCDHLPRTHTEIIFTRLIDKIRHGRADLVAAHQGDGVLSMNFEHLSLLAQSTDEGMWKAIFGNPTLFPAGPLHSLPHTKLQTFFSFIILFGNRALMHHLFPPDISPPAAAFLSHFTDWEMIGSYSKFLHDLHDDVRSVGGTGIPPHIRQKLYSTSVDYLFSHAREHMCGNCHGIVRMLQGGWHRMA